MVAGAASGTSHPVDMRATMREAGLKIKERELGLKLHGEVQNQFPPAHS